MKNIFVLIAALFLTSVCLAGGPKYIFVFIGDGMSFPQRMVAEEFSRDNGQNSLAINTLPVHATTRTSSANSKVTDSAASGTAIACGAKTDNGMIGLAPNGKKLYSVAEMARDKGRKVGIITSVNINHATPASFYGHRKSRNQYYELGLDLVASGFDFFGGGGIIHHNKGNVDIFDLAAKKGYKIVDGRNGLKSLRSGGKYIALGNGRSSNLTYVLNRRPEIPSLPEFVEKAIEVLDNPNGFFIMVEGGLIDYAGHNNELAVNLHEVLEFDAAVKKALEFLKKHPQQTLIVVTGDHETGGLSLTGKLFVKHLSRQKDGKSVFNNKLEKMQQKNPELSFDEVKNLLSESFGFVFSEKSKDDPLYVNAIELKMLQKAFADKKLPNAASALLSSKIGVKWTTNGHSALPVLTSSIGYKSEIFGGFIENSDIANKIKQLLSE